MSGNEAIGLGKSSVTEPNDVYSCMHENGLFVRLNAFNLANELRPYI